jgi:WD40 repeat protein
MHRRVVLAVTTGEYRCASLAFNADGTLLAVGKSNGMVGIWDVRAGEAIQHYLHDLLGGPVHAVAFSADGRLLATGGADRHLKVRELGTGKVILRREHPGELVAVGFDPTGARIATACTDGVLRVWSRAGRIESQVDGGCSASTRSVTFARDGAVVAGAAVEAATPDGSLVATTTGDEIRVLRPVA